MKRKLAVRRHCAAFTLLEVVLALAILAGSVVALGEVIRLATQAVRETNHLTQAELLAASKLAEITSGIVALDPVTSAPLEIGQGWTYFAVDRTDRHRRRAGGSRYRLPGRACDQRLGSVLLGPLGLGRSIRSGGRNW